MSAITPRQSVPFYRPDLSDAEVQEVVATLRSGWLTTGPRVRQFEQAFADAVGARHAIAVNSCTAALHLAVDALALRPGDAVLVPTVTFAATAEVVRYQGAVPVLVDCDPVTLHIDLADAHRKLSALRSGVSIAGLPAPLNVVGVMPVHVGGLMADIHDIHEFARKNNLWIVEDAAHAFPAAWRADASSPWQRCGEDTAAVTCFSFYANKTMTTGEGGMAVTGDAALAARIRLMSLHGLSHDAWNRYTTGGSWDYRIIAPGYKYNLTDIAAAIGLPQLARAEQMRAARQAIAAEYGRRLADVDEIELPPDDDDRVHAWHLFALKLRLDRLTIGRDEFVAELGRAGVRCSVHWRPLHLHPYYRDTFGWDPEDLPAASQTWLRLVSLPSFSAMHGDEVALVADSVRDVCLRFRVGRGVAALA